MTEKTLAELIAATEGRAAEAPPPEPVAALPPEPSPAPAPEAVAPEEPAPVAAAVAPSVDDIDLATLPDNVRGLIERDRARVTELEQRAQEAERRQRAEFKRAQQAQGKLQHLQRTQQGIAHGNGSGVPLPSPAPASASQPATGGAPALQSQPDATAGHAAAATFMQSDGWKRLLRDYPEFEAVGNGFTAMNAELQSVREQIKGSDSTDPRVQRLSIVEERLSELTQANERARFSTFEREHQPQAHVHVKIVRETDPNTGEQYRRHVIEPRSPEFAWFYYSLDADVRDGIDWDDPEDLSAFFTDMRHAATERGLLAPSAPALAPTAPAAPTTAAPVAPANRQRITVAAVPRAPNAGMTTRATSSAGAMSPQQTLAALIAQEEGRVEN